MASLPMNKLKPGLVNLPGATPESAALVAKLLHKDYKEHHCFFNDQGFHNHLTHHVLSLHDLGASAECIQKMYDIDANIQRPLNSNGTTVTYTITDTNWTTKLGEENSHLYADYLAFFSSKIAKHGASHTLEHYIFSPEANGNGTVMLTRFVSGVLHTPSFKPGYGFGLEFGQDFVVAHALASAAVHRPDALDVVDPSGVPEIKSGPSATLLSLLRELYDSPEMAPNPYDPDFSTPAGLRKLSMTDKRERNAAIRALYGKWTFDIDAGKEDFDEKIEECLWQGALLMGATSKAGRKPRADFFLMHFLNGALFLPVFVAALTNPLHKAQLLQAYVRSAAWFVILRGRPHVDAAQAMSYPAFPTPPKTIDGTPSVLGQLGGGSAWLAVLNNAGLHSEPHVIKAIRALFYCAQRYGATPAGGAIGALDGKGNETHKGTAILDGTLFIRVAGVVTDAMGWVAHGDKETFWDFSGLGWEEAWNNAD
ncbi:hypothetical protein C8R43DRAFT_902169 [Mycena crocata]|nr:hypothetical protein C8R43DRAFT_902169 [Mycena crocata]